MLLLFFFFTAFLLCDLNCLDRQSASTIKRNDTTPHQNHSYDRGTPRSRPQYCSFPKLHTNYTQWILEPVSLHFRLKILKCKGKTWDIRVKQDTWRCYYFPTMRGLSAWWSLNRCKEMVFSSLWLKNTSKQQSDTLQASIPLSDRRFADKHFLKGI